MFSSPYVDFADGKPGLGFDISYGEAAVLDWYDPH